MSVFGLAVGFALLVALTYAGTPGTPQIKADEKSKVSGTIVSRSGDLVKVKERKSGQTVVVSLTDNTKIECKKGKVEFFRRKDMDATAMVPGLTVDAEGVGNFKGQLVANKITFALDEFAIEVAEEQQIMANKAAAANAQNDCEPGRNGSGQGSRVGERCAGLCETGTDLKTVAEAGIYFDTRSGRQGCKSRKVEVLFLSIACIRTDSMSGACGGNEAR
jgi:hypothetical protein